MVKCAVRALVVCRSGRGPLLAFPCAVTTRAVPASGVITAGTGGVAVFLALKALGDSALGVI